MSTREHRQQSSTPPQFFLERAFMMQTKLTSSLSHCQSRLPITSCFNADFVVPAINAYARVLLCRRSAARDSVICKTCSRMANISLIKLLIPAKKHNHATSHFEILLDSFYLVGAWQPREKLGRQFHPFSTLCFYFVGATTSGKTLDPLRHSTFSSKPKK